nr:MAG TPA: distal tail protein [Caudoviricetes sp.]
MKTIKLDLYKIDGLTKTFTSRVADTGDTLRVLIDNQGTPVDPSKVSTAILKATKPNNEYVYVDGVKSADGFDFIIPSGFNSIKGYFKRAYVELKMTDGKLYTTQDFLYYSYGDADISESNAGDYISRVEELIKELNDKVDEMIAESTKKVDQLVTDTNAKIKTLKSDIAKMQADLKAFLDTFGNSRPLFFRGKMPDVDWNTIQTTGQAGIYYVSGIVGSANKHTPVTSGTMWGQLTVTVEGVVIQSYTDGAIMYQRRLSGNPLTWSNWRTYLTDSNAYTKTNVYTKTEVDTKIANVTIDAYTKAQTDQKLTDVKNTIPAKATSSEVKAGTVDTKFITPKGLKDSAVLGDSLTTAQVNTLISNAVSAIKTIQVGEWQPLTLNTGFKSADQTTVRYRIITYPDGRKKIEFDGAWTTDSGSIGSSGSTQSQWCILPQELRPAQTKMFPAQCSNFSTTARVAFANNGICYGAQNSGAAVTYIYVTGMSYWIGE